MYRIIPFILILSFASCKHETTIHPQRKDIVETVYASGKILADSEYYSYALSSGTIIKKLIREGDLVSKGQLLYIIKYDGPVARVDAARSNFNLAQSNISGDSRLLTDLRLTIQNAELRFTNDSLQYVRLKKLMEQNIGTQSNLDNAYTNYLIAINLRKSAREKYFATINDLKANVHNTQSQLTSAKTELENYFIRSNINGTIYQTFKEEGEAVRNNDPVALLGKARKRIIRLAVDQQDIDKIQTGQQVLLKTDITGDSIYKALVTKIYPVMNELDQTFRVDAQFSDTTLQPYIHSSVEANIIIRKKQQVLIIPKEALNAGDSVLVKQQSKRKTIPVQTGIRTLDQVEVLQGIDESTAIIIPTKK
ncbi:hypothetical protein A4D02_23100 [Niastella koreensis]|uniref:Efflux transporter RND family, MFP subunit n=2 Tax=Niastella koreensis TaxID=354356 RepID=G8TD34_NIAKG|nr:HlyD family efflux transporter periplasmic adaptor subunit [Niastella koreensis]AEV98266.1 efflux transporter RND family, MFP subunit [Niastella koreensis GR20-10]OQP53280.1 hypothetical protein A4D02_23100 [Niastella koreensis]